MGCDETRECLSTRALGAGGMFRTPPLLRVDLGRKSPQLLGTRGPVDWELVITVHRTHDEEYYAPEVHSPAYTFIATADGGRRRGSGSSGVPPDVSGVSRTAGSLK